MAPCLVTLTDLQTRRAVCQHQLSFLMRVAVPYRKELNINAYTKVPITMQSMSLLQLHIFSS